MTWGIYRVPLIGITQSMVDRAREFFATLRAWRAREEPNLQRRDRLGRLASVVSRGRPIGKVEGTWVTDCAEVHQCILLCSFCDPKFRPAHKQYGYHRDTRFERGVGGDCDGCRAHREEGLQLYVHETHVGQGYAR